MKPLVLGAGGFLGTNLTARLAGAVAFDRVRSAVDATWIEGEFDDPAALASALAGREVVFHLLGPSDPAASNRDPRGDALATIPPTLALLDACVEAGVRRIVYVSSGGTVYGPQTGLPIAEDAPTMPISAYGVGKLAIEKYLGLYRHLHGLESVVLRVANPYGPHQRPGRGQGVIAQLIDRTLRGELVEIWGDGSVIRDFLYVDDVVAALIAAVDAPTGVYNIGSGVGRSLNAVVADVAAAVGREPLVVRKPGRPADIPANVLAIEKARAAFGWTPRVEWADGLARTVEWLSANRSR